MLKPIFYSLIPKILTHYALQFTYYAFRFTYYASHFATEILYTTVENMNRQLKTWVTRAKKNRNFNVIILLRNLNFSSYTVTWLKVQCSLLKEQPGCGNKTVETTESESPSFKKSAYYAWIIMKTSLLCQHNSWCSRAPIMLKIMPA